MSAPVFRAKIPRHGDAFYLDVTHQSGNVIRFAIDALDEPAAFYEAAFVLGGCGDVHASDPAASGTLRRVNGEFVASGDVTAFEEASAS